MRLGSRFEFFLFFFFLFFCFLLLVCSYNPLTVFFFFSSQESDKKLLADDMIASALLDQRAPSRNWYRNKQKTTNEVKGMLRVFLPDDPALDKFVFIIDLFLIVVFLFCLIIFWRFGLRCSVFTIRYFGITMRAAHLKAAVKEQVIKR